MNINNPTTFSSPDLTYTTSNSSGSAGALRADDSIAIFSASNPETIAYGQSAAAGDDAFASRLDHVHGMAASTALSTSIISSSRTASSGAGDQALTGAGFSPTAVIAFGLTNATSVASFGIGDDAIAESVILQKADGNMTYNTTFFIYGLSGSDGLYAVIKTFDADGLTLTWAKDSSGVDVHFTILCFR